VIRRVISGGQTGADFAGLAAARLCGIATGGTAPLGWRTERGNDLRLRDFGLVESPSPAYPPRTRQNVADADLTLIVASRLDGGSLLTARLCGELKKPWRHVTLGEHPRRIADWMFDYPHATINVAGNRESKSPGIEAAATSYLAAVFVMVNSGSGQ
jgi:hypothetical protein